jgi:hypothetical protein
MSSMIQTPMDSNSGRVQAAQRASACALNEYCLVHIFSASDTLTQDTALCKRIDVPRLLRWQNSLASHVLRFRGAHAAKGSKARSKGSLLLPRQAPTPALLAICRVCHHGIIATDNVGLSDLELFARARQTIRNLGLPSSHTEIYRPIN